MLSKIQVIAYITNRQLKEINPHLKHAIIHARQQYIFVITLSKYSKHCNSYFSSEKELQT